MDNSTFLEAISVEAAATFGVGRAVRRSEEARLVQGVFQRREVALRDAERVSGHAISVEGSGPRNGITLVVQVR